MKFADVQFFYKSQKFQFEFPPCILYKMYTNQKYV